MADTTTTQATVAAKTSFFPEKTEQTATPTPVAKEATQTDAIAKPKTKPTMVIDANVLIKSGDLQALTQKYTLATVAQAVKEVRDPNARMRLGTIMGDLKILIPGKEHLSKVADFAKKTGDCVSISVTDANLIALAIMLIEQKGNMHMIRSEPARAEDFGGDPSQETAEGTLQGDHEDDQSDSHPENHPEGQQANQTNSTPAGEDSTQATSQSKEDDVDPDEEYHKATAEDDEGWMVASAPVKTKEVPVKRERKATEDSVASKSVAITSNALTPVTKTPNPEEVGHLAPQLWYEDKDFEQEDEEGWITPSNLKDVVQGSEIIEVSQLESIGVGVMTADFAMQVDPEVYPELVVADGHPAAVSRRHDHQEGQKLRLGMLHLLAPLQRQLQDLLPQLWAQHHAEGYLQLQQGRKFHLVQEEGFPRQHKRNESKTQC